MPPTGGIGIVPKTLPFATFVRPRPSAYVPIAHLYSSGMRGYNLPTLDARSLRTGNVDFHRQAKLKIGTTDAITALVGLGRKYQPFCDTLLWLELCPGAVGASALRR